MRPMDRNWLSSVSARSTAMRASKCAPEPNSMFSCASSIQCAIAHEARNPEIAGDVEHPKPASGLGKLGLQIADVGIVELAEIHFRPLQSIVPPDRVGIPLHQLEEPLDDRFLAACCRPRSRWSPRGPGSRQGPGRKNTKAGRKIFETFVAQRPDRRPFDLGRSIERSRHRRRLVRAGRLRLTLAGTARR